MLLKSDPVRAFVPYPAIAVEGAGSGPLSGLTFGVKDLFDVKGYPTGCGSPVRLAQSDRAEFNAPPVQALLDAGARFVGKTHTEELAWSLYGTNAHFGTPVNPRAPERVPGGSSSGSASAVAAGLCDVALGSDTGGSVRAPASFCGIYGLRPTHGAIDLTHCMPLAPSFDTCGFFARTAEHLSKVGAVLLPPDSTTARRVMIADDLLARLPEAARLGLMPTLEALHHHLGTAEPVSVYDRPAAPIYEAFRHLQSFEAYAAHGAWYEQFLPPLHPAIEGRMHYARAITGAQAEAARGALAGFAAHLHRLLGSDGLLILPVLHGAAPRLDDTPEDLDRYRHEANSFLCIAGIGGLPQVVIPATTLDGAPYGISLVGPRGSDRALLTLAERLS